MQHHKHRHYEDKLTGFLVTSAGEGEVMFQVDFEPHDLKVWFVDEETIHPSSCNPHPNDTVCIDRQHHNGKWYVNITWKVSTEREAEYNIYKILV